MAASAQAWANNGVFEHSDSYDIPPPAGPAGENLGEGFTSGTAVTDAWYSEISNWAFVPGDGTGSTGTTGHFTAMIWKGDKELGCGLYPPTLIWVCRYKADDVLDDNTPNMEGHSRSNFCASNAKFDLLVTQVPTRKTCFLRMACPRRLALRLQPQVSMHLYSIYIFFLPFSILFLFVRRMLT